LKLTVTFDDRITENRKKELYAQKSLSLRNTAERNVDALKGTQIKSDLLGRFELYPESSRCADGSNQKLEKFCMGLSALSKREIIVGETINVQNNK